MQFDDSKLKPVNKIYCFPLNSYEMFRIQIRTKSLCNLN